MAFYDCDECPKNLAVDGIRPCKQPFSHICPYHVIREGVDYYDTLKEVLTHLQAAKLSIEKSRREPWHLDDYYQKISALIDAVEDATNEELIKEYKELFEISG
ncbi:MAG: hypothetical protein ACM3X7_05880 [Solirubrobacterales bacterium]